jgi:hypothetical protein
MGYDPRSGGGGFLFEIILNLDYVICVIWVMITVELPYPLNLEIKEFDIPLPEIVMERGKYLAFLFTDEEQRLNYLEILCDLSELVVFDAVSLPETKDKLNCLKNLIAVLTA